MGIFDKIVNRLNKIGYQKSSLPPIKKKTEILPWDNIPDDNGYELAIANEIPPQWKASDYLEMAIGWVYACSSVIADEIASINLHLYRRKDKEIEEVFEHPLLDLLHKVNSFTTKFDHFWLTQDYLELTGEAPWLVEKDNNNIPIALYLLRPDKISIKLDQTNSESIIEHYSYKVGPRKVLEFKPDQVIFLKYPNPLKPFRGRGTLEAARQTVDLDRYSEEWNTQFFFNAARPDGVLTTEQKLTTEQIKKLRQQWSDNFQGISKRAKLAILEAGLKYQQLQLSQKDMDFLAQQKFSRDKIFSIFRVPKSIVSVSDDVNRANAETQTYAFARWTTKPKMQRIVEQLNEFLVPMFNDLSLFIWFDDPVPENSELKLKRHDSALKSGWMTPNEVREEEHLPSIDGGDNLYMPMNYVPIGSSIIPQKEILQVKDFKDVAKLRVEINKEEKDKITKKEINESIRKVIQFHLKKNGEERRMPKEISDTELFWTKQIEIEEKYEKRFIAKLKDIFESQKKDILNQLEGLNKNAIAKGLNKENQGMQYLAEIKVSIPKIGLNISKENEKMVVIFAPFLGKLIEEIGEYTLSSMESDEDFERNDEINSFLDDYTIKFSDSVNSTTNQKIREQLAEGITNGEGINQLAKRIEEVFSQASKTRANLIARTETSRATNFATIEAYRQSKIVKGKQWLTAFDERTCQFCSGMNGKIIRLKDVFFEEGDSFKGMELSYGDISSPPLHVSCRCTTIPILEEINNNQFQQQIKDYNICIGK